MALIKCKECGAKISSLAKQCPKCGASMIIMNIKKSRLYKTIKKNLKKLIIIFCLILLFNIIIIGTIVHIKNYPTYWLTNQAYPILEKFENECVNAYNGKIENIETYIGRLEGLQDDWSNLYPPLFSSSLSKYHKDVKSYMEHYINVYDYLRKCWQKGEFSVYKDLFKEELVQAKIARSKLFFWKLELPIDLTIFDFPSSAKKYIW